MSQHLKRHAVSGSVSPRRCGGIALGSTGLLLKCSGTFPSGYEVQCLPSRRFPIFYYNGVLQNGLAVGPEEQCVPRWNMLIAIVNCAFAFACIGGVDRARARPLELTPVSSLVRSCRSWTLSTVRTVNSYFDRVVLATTIHLVIVQCVQSSRSTFLFSAENLQANRKLLLRTGDKGVAVYVAGLGTRQPDRDPDRDRILLLDKEKYCT